MAGVEYKPMENAGKSREPPVVKNAGMEKMLILSRCPYKRIFLFKLVMIIKRQDALFKMNEN